MLVSENALIARATGRIWKESEAQLIIHLQIRDPQEIGSFHTQGLKCLIIIRTQAKVSKQMKILKMK